MSNELIFETLRFKNFMATGNVEQVISFKKNGTTFIVGENLDEGGSSGAGKTTIFMALAYVLFDKIPLKVSKNGMINNLNDCDKTLMYVEVEFTVGEVRWKIRRSRGIITEPALWCNDKVVTIAGRAFDAQVEAIIGFSYEIFKQIILFNGKAIAFLDLEGGERRNLIEELIKITILSRKAEALKKQADDTDSSIKIQLALIEQQKGMNDQLQTKIKQTAERTDAWEVSQAAEIARLKEQLQTAKQLQLPCTEEELAELASLKSDIQLLDASIKDLEREKTTAERNALKLHAEHEHLGDKKCPYCKQYFSSDEKLEEVFNNFKLEEAKVSELSPELATLLAEAAPLKDRYAKLSLRVDPREQARVKALIAGIPVLEEKLKSKREAVNPHIAALEALAQSATTQVDTKTLDYLKRLSSHQAILKKLLTDKNSYIRKGIISKTMPFLNKRIAYYTVRLGLPHIVLFQPDLTVTITKLGRELGHGNLSNGEKVRLNLSLCLAFRDTLTFLHSKVNLLLTDEIDGGSLDEQACNHMLGLLKHKAWDDKLSVFIISHRPEFDGRCDRTLIVRKEGGFSTIVEGVA